LQNLVIHLFSDSIYTINFLEFLNVNFNWQEHKVIVYCQKTSKNRSQYLEYRNIELCHSELEIIRLHHSFKTANKIIIHQLNYPRLTLFWLLFYPRIGSKIMWSIWGGDLYNYIIAQSFASRINEWLKTIFVKRIKFIATFIEEDYEHCKSIYKINAKLYRCSYPGTVNKSWLNDSHRYPLQSDTVNIQIGNSADPTNNHIDVLNKLSKYRTQNIKLFIILSYGGSQNYIDKVKKVGFEIFKDKVVFIENYMSPSNYYSLIKNIDIAIFNHDFQQGIGNIKLLLSILKKVYVKQSTTTFQYYTRKGIAIYPSESLENIAYKEFINFNEKLADRNRELLIKDIDESNLYSEWEQILTKPWL